jgi:hypothetical protein
MISKGTNSGETCIVVGKLNNAGKISLTTKKKILSNNRTGLFRKADATTQLSAKKTVDHSAGW